MFLPYNNMNIINSFLISLSAFSAVFLTKLYDLHHNNIYQIGAYLTSILLIFLLINGSKQLTLLNIAVLVKIIPTILLALLGFFVYRDTKLTLIKGIGMFFVIAGLFMLEL